MVLQRTLKRSVPVSGIGLHSGGKIQMVMKPGAPNQGIVFVRKDLAGSPSVTADFRNVAKTQLATTLGSGEVSVSTVEHVLAALQGMGVDNAVIEVDGPEVPIMDGSAAPFVQAIERAGIQSQLQPRTAVMLCRRIEVKLDGKWAVAEPSVDLRIQASIEWDHPWIGYQEFSYTEGKTEFKEIADSRTFGFLRDVEALRRMGLARGGSLENAVVLDDGRVLNPEGLRHPDEFVRHKVLDALGDLKLAGCAIRAKIRLHRSGHDLHWKLLKEIFSSQANYEVIESPADKRGAVAGIGAALMGGRIAASF